jgi:hypothetical protein
MIVAGTGPNHGQDVALDPERAPIPLVRCAAARPEPIEGTLSAELGPLVGAQQNCASLMLSLRV